MPKPKYPNQRTVIIDNKIEKGQIFLMLVKNDLADACKDLNGSGFKVYCYLLSNQDGYKWNISPAHAQKEWGIASSTFKDGIRELIDKGYIANGYIHQRKIIKEDDNRPIKEMDENRASITDTVLSEDENCISNNNNNININNNKDTSSLNAGSILKHPEEEIKGTFTESQMEKDFIYPEGYNWRDHIDENSIWTAPSKNKFKIIFDK